MLTVMRLGQSMSNADDLVLVPRAAMEWLQHHFPTLITKAGFKIIEPQGVLRDDLDFGPNVPDGHDDGL
jgi:hypothetical protein